jgi:anti-sigma factor RsiW
MTVSEQDELLLNAYLDGELDAMEAARFEQRIAADPALNGQLSSRKALSTALRSDLDEDVPPPDLRRRILTGLGEGGRSGGQTPWRALAASFLIGALLAGTASLGLLRSPPGTDIADAIVSAHIRALMAPQPIDVASSDHHTVKPWFNGKIAFAPVVEDLAADGFPLVGGRIDVIGLEPSATLVYRHGNHVISLTERPGASGSSSSLESKRGYNVLAWSDGKIGYWAVSDTAAEELRNFVGKFQAASAGP